MPNFSIEIGRNIGPTRADKDTLGTYQVGQQGQQEG